MAVTANDQAKWLIGMVIDRLEKTPIEFVEALIDLVAAPDRTRAPQLLQDLLLQVWLLLQCPESFVQPLASVDDSPITCQEPSAKPYERLIQILCGMIEAEIFYHWSPKEGKVSLLGGKTSQIFWGGLTLHIKLALGLEPCCGASLCSNGVVTLSNSRSFPCEPPLSESQIYQLITQLGHLFVVEYASAYVRHEQLRCVLSRLCGEGNERNAALLGKESARFELRVQERSLNRYVDKFAARIASRIREADLRLLEEPALRLLTLFDSSSSLETGIAEIIAQASSALAIQPLRTTSLTGRATATIAESFPDVSANLRANREPTPPTARMQHRASETKSIDPFLHLSEEPIVHTLSSLQLLERFTNLQAETIRKSLSSIFIAPSVEQQHVADAVSHIVNFNELASSTNQRLILAASPGGGKTRLQQEILLRACDSHVYHLWIDLAQFAMSGIHSLPRFAANQILTGLNQDRDRVVHLEDDLVRLDLGGQICWHLDRWDEVPKTDSRWVAHGIAALSQFLLSSSNPSLVIEQFESNALTPSSILTIQPFTQSQIVEFLKANLTERSETTIAIERRAIQLPGLARLPNGLEYLCLHPEHETVIDLLLGYINSNLRRRGDSLLNPEELVFETLHEITLQSDSLGSAYLVVKALCRRTKVTFIDVAEISIDEILPYMGANNREENGKLAIERMEKAVQGKLLQSNRDGRTYAFVVPEVGYLLGALSILVQHHGRRWLDAALKEFQRDPSDPLRQMTLALGAWHQERLFRQYISGLLSSGTVVPSQVELPLTLPGVIHDYSQT